MNKRKRELIYLRDQVRRARELRGFIRWGTVRAEMNGLGIPNSLLVFKLTAAMSPTRPTANEELRAALRLWLDAQRIPASGPPAPGSLIISVDDGVVTFRPYRPGPIEGFGGEPDPIHTYSVDDPTLLANLKSTLEHPYPIYREPTGLTKITIKGTGLYKENTDA
jgi:hypothetical protein